MMPVAIVGALIFMLLWSLAWRNRPRFAFGIYLGVASACVIVPLVRLAGIRHMPVWLPALPFAVIAITLLCFGILAWRWGRSA